MVYLKTKNVKSAAGAQHIDRGIQRGLVRSTSKRTQKARAARIKITLDWRKISRRKIMLKRRNLRRNFAV